MRGSFKLRATLSIRWITIGITDTMILGNCFAPSSVKSKMFSASPTGFIAPLHDYIPPETADCFLDAIDSGYPTWRYFLLEGEMPPSTHPGAMLEIWSALWRHPAGQGVHESRNLLRRAKGSRTISKTPGRRHGRNISTLVSVSVKSTILTAGYKRATTMST